MRSEAFRFRPVVMVSVARWEESWRDRDKQTVVSARQAHIALPNLRTARCRVYIGLVCPLRALRLVFEICAAIAATWWCWWWWWRRRRFWHVRVASGARYERSVGPGRREGEWAGGGRCCGHNEGGMVGGGACIGMHLG